MAKKKHIDVLRFSSNFKEAIEKDPMILFNEENFKKNTYKIIKQEYNVGTGDRKTWVELKPVKKPKK